MTARVLAGGLLCLLGFAGCVADAEHTNPLDPLAEGYQDAGALTGTAGDMLFRPVAGATVRLVPAGADSAQTLLAETGANGTFQFDSVPGGSYRLRLTKNGFLSIEDTVLVEIGALTQVGNLTMNALPHVTSVSMRTFHISRWWPEDDLFLLDVRLDALDPDERPGIDSVWLSLPAEGITHQLVPGVQPGRFVRVLPADSLPGGSVHAVVGQEIAARIRDRDGNVVVQAIPGPVRVLDQTPLALSPQGLETVPDPRPTLTWAPLDMPFAMTYRVEVIRDEANTDVLVQQHESISQDSTSFRLPAALSAGSYYWTVAVVDAHGNLTRSKEAGFRVN